MLTKGSMDQTVKKLARFADMLSERIFTTELSINDLQIFITREPLHAIPDASSFIPLQDASWGGEGVYGWFKGSFTVPESLSGKALFLWPRMDFYEATLWLNGCIHSNYANKFVEGSHGNHYCNRITAGAKAGESFALDLECYAWHMVPGTHPFKDDRRPSQNFRYACGPLDVCTRDDEVMDFVFDLNTLLSLRYVLEKNDYRLAEVENALYEAHLVLNYDFRFSTTEELHENLALARPILRRELEKKNAEGGYQVGLIGHSHMDTAWLWPLTETEKKCARTYANQLNLMAEYPEYLFVQSSSYHSDVLRRKYPELFARIQQAVRDGRYEPNGGVWVECDCNLTGAEYMVRQFVWGQRFTKKYFDYVSDCFWLPDTFGYSFAIPQIMEKCGVKYFLTTKMSWNDTNTFPYTTFFWQGLDGTRVLTHLNKTHIGPTPETLHEITDGEDCIRENRVSPWRLFSFGKGDGGGGPEFEMIESARRLQNLQGVPKTAYMTVSDFMHHVEETMQSPTVYADELYLELHRGTLTNQHEIKRNNRKLEIALHNLEAMTVRKAIAENAVADESGIAPLVNTLLVRQFHDILPGTCIHTVLDEARRTVSAAITEAEERTLALLPSSGDTATVSLYNPLSFDRKDTVYLTTDASGAEGFESQSFTDLDGCRTLAVAGVSLPSLGAVSLCVTDDKASTASPFTFEGDSLKTPFARIRFDENGFLASVTDLRNGRELVSGLPFGTLLMAEDVSQKWDNWDVDADLEEKFRPAGKLIAREVIADGPVEFRIRCTWQLTAKSSVTQDMIFDAASPLISFDTRMDWHEEHCFLKVAFDTSLHADGVRSEIQFGCIRRTNHRSTSWDKARFEICNHKYSDLSENNYGIALLNDCKYGLSVLEGSLRLSLHKSGVRPDPEGDKGLHSCRYAILPHEGGFGAETVVQPAYRFNYAPVAAAGASLLPASLVNCDKPNVVVETVKPCEDAQKAYILRLYESVGDYTPFALSFGYPVQKVTECNMLEEDEREINPAELVAKPFEIKTLKVYY